MAAPPTSPAAISLGAELDQRSNALALRLHAEIGPGPEPIAIVGVTGTDMVIAPVAILKSGRPYTWIDAASPLCALATDHFAVRIPFRGHRKPQPRARRCPAVGRTVTAPCWC